MNVFIDIETIPSSDRDHYLNDARENFRAPSGLTKGQAGKDLGLEGDALKYAPADEVKARWEKEMASAKSEELGDINWRKTSFDGTYGRVVSIGWGVGGDVHAPIAGPENEAQLIRDAFQAIRDALKEKHKGAEGRQPFFIGHNVVFDLKFLFRRCVILGVKPPFDLPFGGRHGKDYFCTSRAWCEYNERISLDNLCKALGVKGKDGFDGSMVCDAWLAGEFDTIKEYCADDVRRAQAIYNKLKFEK